MTYRFHEIYESVIQQISSSQEHEDADVLLSEERISSGLSSAVDEAATSLLTTIKSDAFPQEIESMRADRLGFEERLVSKWGYAFDLLELFVQLATGMGSDFNDELRKEADLSNDVTFQALTRLHGRACQVANEILALLRSGYADGAHARWRTLHEISVTACLIGDHGQELAERYLLHEPIQQYKTARQYVEYCDRLDLEPITEEELSELQQIHDKLVCKFGRPFKNDYGWAASVIGKDRPSFRDIEAKVELDHMRPYYRMASDNVHANVHGSIFRLGLSHVQGDVILTGPSDAGLADPGHSAAISLCQVTSVLLASRPIVDNIICSSILRKLTEEVGEAFINGHNLVESLSRDESD